MLCDEPPQPREAEHLTFRVMCLYYSVAVEQCCLPNIEHGLLLLVAHARHESQGHPPRSQFLAIATLAAQVGEIVARVGVYKTAALGVEDAIEAGDKHVGRDTS